MDYSKIIFKIKFRLLQIEQLIREDKFMTGNRPRMGLGKKQFTSRETYIIVMQFKLKQTRAKSIQAHANFYITVLKA